MISQPSLLTYGIQANVAALYVQTGGAYYDLPGVDPWDEARDARLYSGPLPVVAHPPCERWGRYARGGPSASWARTVGDDGGCFAAALASVRQWGGVIEHPEASHAWRHFGLVTPPKRGGWVSAGDGIGQTYCVEQGHYGHPARKATWLYAVNVDLPALRWGASAATLRLDDGFRTAEERRAARAAGAKPCLRVASRLIAATPPAFRDLLLAMARSARVRSAAA